MAFTLQVWTDWSDADTRRALTYNEIVVKLVNFFRSQLAVHCALKLDNPSMKTRHVHVYLRFRTAWPGEIDL